MLDLENPSKGLLFFSFLYRSDLFTEEVFTQKVESLFGTFMTHSPEFNPLAQYYAKEMGDISLLNRIFYVSTRSYPREFLLTSKLMALEWERQWAIESKRMVNVDTGLISAESFILATTKNYSHRVFLGQNIFADLTYHCFEGTYQTLPWTYPDFKDQAKIDFFSWCRSYLLMHSKV